MIHVFVISILLSYVQKILLSRGDKSLAEIIFLGKDKITDFICLISHWFF